MATPIVILSSCGSRVLAHDAAAYPQLHTEDVYEAMLRDHERGAITLTAAEIAAIEASMADLARQYKNAYEILQKLLL